jgi:Co/Zn/Cd efflux system component
MLTIISFSSAVPDFSTRSRAKSACGEELVGGIVSNSLALLADAGHLFTDVAGIGLALLAIVFAGRPANGGGTFG